MKKITIVLLISLVCSLLLVGCGANDTAPSVSNSHIHNEQPNNLPKEPSAYNFTMEDEDGNTEQLINLSNKPIVLNFWASWCDPCKNELGDFETAYKLYGDKVNFVMLSVDRTMEEAKAIKEENGYTFPIYLDKTGSASYFYQIDSIPQTFFINSKGEIHSHHQGMISLSKLETTIKELIK